MNLVNSISLVPLKCFIFFICFWAFGLEDVKGQCPPESITLSTQQEIDDFVVNYPGCTEILVNLNIEESNSGDITSLNGLSNLISIEGSLRIRFNDSLSSLAGLDNLISAGRISLSNNNALTDLVSLSNITYTGGVSIHSNNSLLNLSGLNGLDSINGNLSIGTNSLSSLTGLENLTFVNGRFHITNSSNLLNLTGLDNLTSINESVYIGYNDSLTNLSGLNNLSSIGNLSSLGGDVEVSPGTIAPSMGIIGNDGLNNLTGFGNMLAINGTLHIGANDTLNNLIGMNVNINTLTNLKLTDNQNLSICGIPDICTYLANGGAHDINDNASSCADETAILNTCENLGRIYFASFYDINQNKIQDNGEPNYYDASLLITPGNTSFFPNQQSNVFYLDHGSYTVSYEYDDTTWELTSDSVSYFVSLEQYEIDTFYFGIYPNELISDVIATVTSPATRCSETVIFDINIKNLGTTNASGTMWLEGDENILTTNFIDTPDTTVAPNQYGWFFSNLYLSHSIEKQIALQIPGPPDFPIGDTLTFHAYVDFEDENGTNTSPTFTYNPEVRCSYDPNDKLVNPAREGDYALFDEDLIYTVRFQNTGNDVAYDVVILDNT